MEVGASTVPGLTARKFAEEATRPASEHVTTRNQNTGAWSVRGASRILKTAILSRAQVRKTNCDNRITDDNLMTN